jgi:hypothetical protein
VHLAGAVLWMPCGCPVDPLRQLLRMQNAQRVRVAPQMPMQVPAAGTAAGAAGGVSAVAAVSLHRAGDFGCGCPCRCCRGRHTAVLRAGEAESACSLRPLWRWPDRTLHDPAATVLEVLARRTGALVARLNNVVHSYMMGMLSCKSGALRWVQRDVHLGRVWSHVIPVT